MKQTRALSTIAIIVLQVGPIRNPVQSHVVLLCEALGEYQFSATVDCTAQPTGGVGLGRWGMEFELANEEAVLVVITLGQCLQFPLQTDLQSQSHCSATDQDKISCQILAHINGTLENRIQDDIGQSQMVIVVREESFKSSLS